MLRVANKFLAKSLLMGLMDPLTAYREAIQHRKKTETRLTEDGQGVNTTDQRARVREP